MYVFYRDRRILDEPTRVHRCPTLRLSPSSWSDRLSSVKILTKDSCPYYFIGVSSKDKVRGIVPLFQTFTTRLEMLVTSSVNCVKTTVRLYEGNELRGMDKKIVG